MSHEMSLRTPGSLPKLILEPILALQVVFTIQLLTTRPSNDVHIQLTSDCHQAAALKLLSHIFSAKARDEALTEFEEATPNPARE